MQASYQRLHETARLQCYHGKLRTRSGASFDYTRLMNKNNRVLQKGRAREMHVPAPALRHTEFQPAGVKCGHEDSNQNGFRSYFKVTLGPRELMFTADSSRVAAADGSICIKNCESRQL